MSAPIEKNWPRAHVGSRVLLPKGEGDRVTRAQAASNRLDRADEGTRPILCTAHSGSAGKDVLCPPSPSLRPG